MCLSSKELFNHFGYTTLNKGTLLYHGTKNTEEKFPLFNGMFLALKLSKAGYGGFHKEDNHYRYELQEDVQLLNAWRPRCAPQGGPKCSLDDIFQFIFSKTKTDIKVSYSVFHS